LSINGRVEDGVELLKRHVAQAVQPVGDVGAGDIGDETVEERLVIQIGLVGVVVDR
jgi:hypothetical protein